MENNMNFRKAKIGGFNKKDVISYIEKMRNDFFDYKNAVESTIDKLNAKIGELEALTSEGSQQVKEIIVEVPIESDMSNDPLTNINEATSQLRMVADELCRNLTDFMSKINIDSDAQCEKASKPEIFDDVEAYIEETAKEIFENKEETSVEPVVENNDRVSAILNSSLNFSFDKGLGGEAGHSCSVCDVKSEEKSILDTLNKSSFFC